MMTTSEGLMPVNPPNILPFPFSGQERYSAAMKMASLPAISLMARVTGSAPERSRMSSYARAVTLRFISARKYSSC